MAHPQRYSPLIAAGLGLLLLTWGACSPKRPGLALEIVLEDQRLGPEERTLVRQNLRALAAGATGLPLVERPQTGDLALLLYWRRQDRQLHLQIGPVNDNKRLRNTIALGDSDRLRFEELVALLRQAQADFGGR